MASGLSYGDGRKRVTPQEKGQVNRKLAEFLSLLKFFDSYFSEDVDLQDKVKMRVVQGLKTFGATN